MPSDLVQVTTRDDIRLHGMFQKGESSSNQLALPIDAACLIHGTGGNFYSSSLFDDLSERLLGNGCSILRVNTRGHDGISTAATSRGGKVQGAAYELVSDCRHDVAAWLEWLRQREYSKVALIGHSLGAVKCIYALAQDPGLPASCLIALSPPRLSYSWFCQSDRAETFSAAYLQAQQLIEEGKPSQLMEVTFPLPFVVTAAGYVEKYGPDERYNFLTFVAGVPCPLLITFGRIEMQSNVAFQGSVQALAGLAPAPQNMVVHAVEGGDHFYTSVREELANCIENWLHDLAAKHLRNQ